MERLSRLVKPYQKVIQAFKNRADVQSGDALAYREGQSIDGKYELIDKPHDIGEGTTNTGWCVSVSQALIMDPIFNILIKDQGAQAKLVSIDIKEQYYGTIYQSGMQNKWHSAILIRDNEVNFIIDLTCGQFGNYFIGKEIWDFET